MLRQNKILGNMLGAEIDFIVKGIETKSRSIVASRKDAMLKKRQLFYMNTDAAGMYRIYDGRVVQARVIAVAEKVIRMLDNMFQQLFDKGLSQSTVRYAQRILSVSMEAARKYRYIEHNPARDIITKFGKQGKTPDPYTIEQVQQFMSKIIGTEAVYRFKRRKYQ